MFGGSTYALSLSNTGTQEVLHLGSAGALNQAYWTGATDAVWSDANWNNAVSGGTSTTPTSATDLYFSTTSPTPPPSSLSNQSIGALTAVNSVNFLAGSGTVTVTGSGTLTINAGTAVSSGPPNGITDASSNPQTISTAIALGGPQYFLNSGTALLTLGAVNNGGYLLTTSTNTGGGNIAIGGVLSGAGGLAANGTGTSTLTLNSANTFSGPLTITGGIVTTNSAATVSSAQGMGVSGILNLNGGTFQYTAQVPALIRPPNSRPRSTSALSGGTLDTTTGFIFYGGSFTGSGTLNFLSSSFTNNYQWLITGNSPSFSGNITIGNGTNSNSGWVQYRSSNASPLGSGTITINGGGILSSDNGATNPSTLANNLVLNGGTLEAQNAAVNFTGNVTVNPSTSSFLTLTVGDTANIILSGNITGSGTLTENGGGFSVELHGNNSGFTGTYNHTATGATIFYTTNSASTAQPGPSPTPLADTWPTFPERTTSGPCRARQALWKTWPMLTPCSPSARWAPPPPSPAAF